MAGAFRWLTVADIMADLKVSRETVYGWLRSGELPSKRYGRQYRVRSDDYAAWCDSRPDGEMVTEAPREEQPKVRRSPQRPPGEPVKRLVDLGAMLARRQAAVAEGSR